MANYIDEQLAELNAKYGFGSKLSPAEDLQESMGVIQPPSLKRPAVEEPVQATPSVTAPPVVPSPEPTLEKPQFAPKKNYTQDVNAFLSGMNEPQQPTQPAVPVVEPPKSFGGPKEFVSGLLSGMGHSATKAIPEMAGEVSRAPGYLMGGVVPEDRLKEPEVEAPQTTDVGEAAHQAGEMMGPSLLPSAVGAGAGMMIAGPPGAYIGAQVIGQVGAFSFGLSEYTRAREEGYRKNQELIARGEQPLAAAEIEWQAIKRGAIEWGGETIANAAFGKFFKASAPLLKLGKKVLSPTLKGVVKPTLTKVAASIPELLFTEVGTEMLQQGGEAYVSREAGVRPEAQPWQEAKGVIAPTAIMSILLAGAGNVSARVSHARSVNALNPNTPNRTDTAVMEQRGKEADDFMKIINASVGPDAARTWRGLAGVNIMAGEDIDMDQSLDVADLATNIQATLDRMDQAKLGPGKTLNRGEQQQGPVVPEEEQWRLNEASLVKPIDFPQKIELEEPGVPFQKPQPAEEHPGPAKPPMDLSHPQGKGEIEFRKIVLAGEITEEPELNYHNIENKPVVPFGATQLSLWGVPVPPDQTEGGEGPEATPQEPPPPGTPEGPPPPSSIPATQEDLDELQDEPVGKPDAMVTPDIPSGGVKPEEPRQEVKPPPSKEPPIPTGTAVSVGGKVGKIADFNPDAAEDGSYMVGFPDGSMGEFHADSVLPTEPIVPEKEQPGSATNKFYAEVRIAAEELGDGMTYGYEVQLYQSNAPIVLPPHDRITFENFLESELEKHTNALGGKVTQVGTGKLGTSIYEIQRPYGKLTYNEVTGELTASPVELTSKLMTDETVDLGVDKTLLAQVISKDLVNNNLADTMTNEPLQNSLDSGATRIDISVKVQDNNGIQETLLIVKDNGRGMSKADVKERLMMIGAEGKEGTLTRGGYGLAKAAFLLAPRRTVMTTVQNGVKTIVSGTKEQFFGLPGESKPYLGNDPDVKEPNGTTFEMSFYADHQDASKDNAYALTRYNIEDAIKRYLTKGVNVHGVNLTYNGELFPSYGLDTLRQIFSMEKFSLEGSDVEVYFVPDSKPSTYRTSNGFKLHVETFNKGLAIFSMDPAYTYATHGLRQVAKWKAIVNFVKTPKVKDIRYPFIRNRTVMHEKIRQMVEEKLNAKIREINLEEFSKAKKEFAWMIQNSPVMNGTQVLIPFIDKAEFEAARALVMNHQELMSDMANLIQVFQVIVDKIGESKMSMSITVDPTCHGFRSKPEVTGHEIFALNPFAITEALIMTEEWKKLVGATYPKWQAMSSNLTHTLVHELAHRRVPTHEREAEFSSEMVRLYTLMTHAQLTRFENEGRAFYAKHGDNLRELQKHFSNMGKGGSRFQEGNNALQTPGGQLAGLAGGDQVLQENSAGRNGQGIAHRLISKSDSMIGGERLDGQLVLAPEQHKGSAAAVGGKVPSLSYKDGERGNGNVLVSQSKSADKSKSVLLLQFSNELINPMVPEPQISRQFFDLLYGNRRSGYAHPRDFFEIPQWIAVASNSLPNSDVYVVRNIAEAVAFLKQARYKTVAMSVLEANKDLVQQIVDGYSGTVALGGYIDLGEKFGYAPNVKRYDKIDRFVRDEGYRMIPGTNYRHFEGTEVIPRLMLSEGCLFLCKFCTVTPHGALIETSPENIRRQIESFKRLNARLVYLNDKTFGQASNYTMLAEIYDEMKAANPNFEGFVIQTTASQFLKLNNDFIAKSGIKYVEIGVESYNDEILRKYTKPHTVAQIDKAMQRARENGLKVIPNIIIGMPEETTESYQRTLDFLYRNRDIISHVNPNNLAIYKGTPLEETIKSVTLSDSDELKIEKSFHQPGSAQLHMNFNDAVFQFGIEQLNVPENQLASLQPGPAPALPRFASRRGVSPGDGSRSISTQDIQMLRFNKANIWDKSLIESLQKRIRSGEALSPVEVYLDDKGEIYVVDGHHRAAAYAAEGKAIPFVETAGENVAGIDSVEWEKMPASLQPKVSPSMSGRRLGEAGEASTVSIPEVQKEFDVLLMGLAKKVIRMMAVKGFMDIPEQIRRANTGLQPTDKAFYDRSTNTMWVITDNHADMMDVRRSIFHELIGHFGLEKLIGPARLRAFANKVFELYGGEQGLAEFYTAYRLIPGSEESKMIAALEKVSQISEDNSNPGLWQEFVTLVKEILGNIFGKEFMNLSENDIRVYLKRSRQLIMDERFQAQVQRYASLVQLNEANAWKTGLPTKRFAMRVDTVPSDVSPGTNFFNFGKWWDAYRQNDEHFAEENVKDLSPTMTQVGNPFWIAKQFPEFSPMFDVQLERQDKRNMDTIELLKLGERDNPYLLEKLNRDRVNKLIVWSDIENVYLEGTALQEQARALGLGTLSQDEVNAYRGWKEGFSKAIEFIVDRNRKIIFKVNEKQPWYNDLVNVVTNHVDPKTLPSGQAIDSAAFMAGIKYTEKKLKQLNKLAADLRSFNFYMPRERGKGEYVVRAYDVDAEGHEVRVEARRFETATAAEMGRQEMQRAYSDLKVLKTKERGTSEYVYGALDVAVMEAFLQKSMERAERFGEITEEAADILMKNVMGAIDEEISARGFRQKYMHRRRGEPIKGYETKDLDKVFVNYMKGLAGSMSKLEAAFDFHDALNKIDRTKQRDLYEYASRYMTDMLRNPETLDRRLNALKTIPYAWYLAANLRMVPVQMTQNFVTAIPILARLMKENNVKGSSSSEIMRAMKDVATGSFSAQEKKMLDEAWAKGETMANYLNQIRGRIDGGWAKGVFQKTLDLFSLPFAGMERFNRKTAYLAGYRMYVKAGMNHPDAFRASRDFVNMSHYAYGQANMPQLLRDGTAASKVLGMGYVFQSFRHNYLLSIKHFAKNKKDKLALDMMFRSLAFLVLFGGLGAFPFLDDILEEAEKMFGKHYRSEMRSAMRKVGGEILADVGMQGVPALIGFDLSGSLKIGVPIPGVGGQLQDSVFGVWGGLIDKAKSSIGSVLAGDFARAIEAAAPSGLEMPLKAARLSKEGIRTASGKQILDEKGKPIKPTIAETVGQSMGFRPQRFAEVSQERRVSANVQEHYTKKKQDILKRLRLGKDLDTVRRDIQKFNLDVMKFKGLISPIGLQSMSQAMKPDTGYMEYKRKGNF